MKTRLRLIRARKGGKQKNPSAETKKGSRGSPGSPLNNNKEMRDALRALYPSLVRGGSGQTKEGEAGRNGAEIAA